MENQINVGDLNPLQTGQNPVRQPLHIPTKLKGHYWKIITFILLFLLIISFITRRGIFEGLTKKDDFEVNRLIEVSKNPTPVPTTYPYAQPTVPTTLETPVSGTSYGIFYPFSEGITINNALPTIIGKVSQNSEVFLVTKFGIEKSPVSGEDEYFLRFIPGRIKQLKVKIDNVEISKVFGTPQYPTVLCKNINVNPDGTSTIDPKTGKKYPPDDVFTSESECFKNKSSEIPPLVFFTRPSIPLSEGKHTLTLEGNDTFQAMTFYVDSDYHLTSQNIFVVDKNTYYNQYSLIRVDNCGEGYYYDNNYLKIPLPSFANPKLYFGISFPQAKEELGSVNRRRVQIAFENVRYVLFFPQSSTYYEGKSANDRKNPLSPYHELFLPKDQLIFTDGSKASYVDAYVIIPQDGNYALGYFEVYPVDITGGEYRNSSIPWIVSGSSGCDG